jgi:hypothetical protein
VKEMLRVALCVGVVLGGLSPAAGQDPTFDHVNSCCFRSPRVRAYPPLFVLSCSKRKRTTRTRSLLL